MAKVGAGVLNNDKCISVVVVSTTKRRPNKRFVYICFKENEFQSTWIVLYKRMMLLLY